MVKAALRVTSLFAAAIGMVGWLGLAQPATAASGDIGTPAFTNHAVRLYTDGDWQGRLVGQLPGALPVQVDRCSRLWCKVHGRFGHGWVFLYSLSFGEGPNSIWWPQTERRHHYHPLHRGMAD